MQGEADTAGRGTVEAGEELVLPIHAETAEITKRRTETTVRAARTTAIRQQRIEEDLVRQHVVVERVPVGRPVDSVPPPREEGDTLILPVVEEVLVVERRLVLKEEVHLRRVRSVHRHAETVPLREQHVVVTRTAEPSNPYPKEQPMMDKTPNVAPAQDTYVAPQGSTHGVTGADEIIVAVFDNQAHAQAAIRDLRQAGIAETAISQHSGSVASGAATPEAAPAPQQERGFWASLFGGDSDYDHNVYDRSVETGSTVVTVRVPEPEAARVTQILEEHHPVDIDERASGYGYASTGTSTTTTTTGATGIGTASMGATTASTAPATTALPATGAAGETLQLSEEKLAIGKRLVNRGGTRIRRYVVERPVEEQVTLHDEKVVVERRPVTGDRPATAEFTDKTIEMTESHEEAVVGKTARVVEEVALRKEGTERVETVRDTVRREEVEVEQLPGSTTATPPRGTGV